MKALVTGASSGIGRDMAKYLGSLGYDLVIVARRKDRLEELAKNIKTNVTVIDLDLSVEENCYTLYDRVKNENIDVLINNAGFGLFGDFCETDLETEIRIINTNIKAVHILTKLFLIDMKKRNNGHILNVSSISGFAPGPLMATYYSSKSYVLKLTQSIYQELKKAKSNVKISVLCPGPVKTEFNNVANVKFGTRYLSSMTVAKYAIDKMLKNNLVIIPGISIKCARILTKILPDKIIMKFTYNVQKRKR